MTSVAATTFAPVFAAAAEERRAAVVSLHDVAPATFTESARILEELKQYGIRSCSLLVVPDYHHLGPSLAHPEFVRWLRDAEADGHEIVIHGYYHQRPRGPTETVRDKWITRFYTSDEGEFYDLPYSEAARRIAQAREEFGRARLTPRGFIAPAWLLGWEAERAAFASELEYTTRLTEVLDLRNGEAVRARSLVYSVRSEWRRSASLVWNRLLWQRLANAPLVRLSLHPPDIHQPRIWAQIKIFAKKISETRTATTYRDWVAERRAAAAR